MFCGWANLQPMIVIVIFFSFYDFNHDAVGYIFPFNYSMNCWLFLPTAPIFLLLNNVFFNFMSDDREYAYNQCCFTPLRQCFELLGKLMFFYMFLFFY